MLRIIQLLSHGSDLLALTADGKVYIWNPNMTTWTEFGK